MSILIKGMEMPTSCDVCPLIAEADDYHVCYINEQFIPWEWIDEHSAEQRHPKPSWCPLIPVPPHGRLIDADKAAKQGWTISRTYSASPTEMVYEAKTMTDEVLPTIIEAEEGE